jgi:hypothetical protein
MYSNRRAILSLVAHGRITPAEAERLISACSSERETWWLLAGCALCAGLAQIQPHAFTGHALNGMVHLFRSVIDGTIPALHHALSQVAACIGGTI